MSLKIDQDHSRFRAIVRGRIRQNLRKYISQGELIGRHGKDVVSIPIPQIDIPHFSFGDRQRGGAGQGEGDPGDPMGGDPDGEEGEGRQAGSSPGDHALEVDVTLDELAAILGEELELPDIEGKSKIINEKDRYVWARRTAPCSPAPAAGRLRWMRWRRRSGTARGRRGKRRPRGCAPAG